MHQFTTILWDVDNTLLDFQYSQAYALRKCFEDRGLVLTDRWLERYDRINTSYWERLERGEITRKELLTGRFYTLFGEMGITDIPVPEILSQYQENLGKVYCYLEDSITLLTSLKGEYRQYAVTNGDSRTQREKLRLAGFDRVLDGIFISDDIGVQKPGRGFFEYVLREIPEKNLSAILIVGDSLTSDIKGGFEAGIPTCWYNRTGKPLSGEISPDYMIETLRGIYRILEEKDA